MIRGIIRYDNKHFTLTDCNKTSVNGMEWLALFWGLKVPSLSGRYFTDPPPPPPNTIKFKVFLHSKK